MIAERKSVAPLKRLRFQLTALALRALGTFVRLLPRSTVVQIGHLLGHCAYHLSGRLREISLANLAVAFDLPDAEKARVARASLQSAAATLLALPWLSRLTKENFRRFVDVDEASLQSVREIQARGKGIIFIPLHYGDWELLGHVSGFLGMESTIVQEAMRNVPVQQLLQRWRAMSGHQVIERLNAARTLFKALKRGGNIALLIDQNATRSSGGDWLEFFGLPVFNNAAVGVLALRTGAAIVPGVAHPLPGGRVRIVYGPEISYTEGDDAHAVNQRCLAWCEQVIRAAPEYWLWCYKRWTPRATPEQGRYPAYSRYVADIAPLR